MTIQQLPKFAALARGLVAFAALTSLTATPTWAAMGDQLFKFTASDAAVEDGFGISVALGGDQALIGSHFDDDKGDYSGSAYVFDTTTGQQLSKLTASDGAAGDQLGFSVAMSGHTALVGAVGKVNRRGAAYLFDSNTGQQLFKLTASDAANIDNFGWCVALSGNKALVGAWGNDDAGDSSGSAYVFDATTGQQLFKLTASDATEQQHFGYSVALSSNRALIGAPGSGYIEDGAGAAYLFDVTTGQQLYKLQASDVTAGDSFGRSVALDGNFALVKNNGAAYLFDVTTGQQQLKFPTPVGSGPIALSGTLAVIGTGTGNNSAYVFDVTTGEQLMNLTAPFSSNYFGASVALDNNMSLIGDSWGFQNKGQAFLFDVTPQVPGDFNGDGDVDGSDFVAWQSRFPLASGATLGYW